MSSSSRVTGGEGPWSHSRRPSRAPGLEKRAERRAVYKRHSREIDDDVTAALCLASQLRLQSRPSRGPSRGTRAAPWLVEAEPDLWRRWSSIPFPCTSTESVRYRVWGNKATICSQRVVEGRLQSDLTLDRRPWRREPRCQKHQPRVCRHLAGRRFCSSGDIRTGPLAGGRRHAGTGLRALRTPLYRSSGTASSLEARGPYGESCDADHRLVAWTSPSVVTAGGGRAI